MNVLIFAPSTPHRWRAIIEYRSKLGVQRCEFRFEEIEELHDIIESGPHWDTLIKCTVTKCRVDDGNPTLTIEEALIRGGLASE